MEEQQFTCIICPQGCQLKAKKGENGYEMAGFKCGRGKEYGLNEATDPRRTLTATVSLSGGIIKRLPVKSSQTLPKKLIFSAKTILEKIIVKAPIDMGEIVVKNILDTGIDIIATRDITT